MYIDLSCPYGRPAASALTYLNFQSSVAATWRYRGDKADMLKFHRTSILESNAQTVVNTVNTVGVMGKGLAAAFKEKYPEMFRQYRILCKNGELSPGSFWLWKGSDQWILNFATKKDWRKPSQLDYVRNGLVEFCARYQELGIREIAFPRLGCGNGGLDWLEVRPLMIEYLKDLPISIYIHDFEKSISKPEHDLPLFRTQEPENFEYFCRDLEQAISSKAGQVGALGFSKKFSVRISPEECDLWATSNCENLIASNDDLYRVWSLLLEVPVSRFDLPETPYNHALKFFSVLSELSYIRPIILANSKGRPQLAVEMSRNNRSERAQSMTE